MEIDKPKNAERVFFTRSYKEAYEYADQLENKPCVIDEDDGWYEVYVL